MSGIDHSTRIGSVGIKSGSVGITDGDIHVTSGSIDTTIIGSVPVYGDVEVGTVPVIGAFYPGSQKVYGDVEVGTVPVIGDFYPGTQNVGVIGSVEIYGDVAVGTVPVIGDFYPGSQKVYGDIEVGTVPVIGNVEVGTVPVIGDFYPGSQRVYGDIEVGTVPVIGAFYPGTQNVDVIGSVEVYGDIEVGTVPVIGSVGIRSGSIGITDISGVGVDPDTKSLHVIDGEHIQFHEGKRFRTCIGYPAVADGGSAHMLIHVGSMQIHPILAVSAEGLAHGRIFEGANPSYLGTENSVFDMNRSTRNTPESRAYYTLNMGTLGTMIACVLIPGGTGPKSIGAINKSDSAWLFGSLTNYVIEIVNKGGVNKDMQIEFEFLEY